MQRAIFGEGGGKFGMTENKKNRTMEIKELQERVDAWIKEYGVRYFSELTNMVVLTEEVGELAQRFGSLLRGCAP